MWGFHAGTSITAHVQHLFTSLRQTFTPPAFAVGRLWGGKKTRGLSSSWQSPCLTDTKPQCSRVQEGCPGKLTSFVHILLCPHLRPQYYPANGVVSSRERETAVNTLELPTAAVASNHPWFFPTFSTGRLLPQPSVVSTNLKGTAWEPRRHVDKDVFSRGFNIGAFS